MTVEFDRFFKLFEYIQYSGMSRPLFPYRRSRKPVNLQPLELLSRGYVIPDDTDVTHVLTIRSAEGIRKLIQSFPLHSYVSFAAKLKHAGTGVSVENLALALTSSSSLNNTERLPIALSGVTFRGIARTGGHGKAVEALFGGRQPPKGPDSRNELLHIVAGGIIRTGPQKWVVLRGVSGQNTTYKWGKGPYQTMLSVADAKVIAAYLNPLLGSEVEVDALFTTFAGRADCDEHNFKLNNPHCDLEVTYPFPIPSSGSSN